MDEPMEVDDNSNLPLADVLDGSRESVDQNGFSMDFVRSFAENVLTFSMDITKKNAESNIKAILKSICAILNSGGGVLMINITDFSEHKYPLKSLDEIWSKLEEKLRSMISPSEYADVFDRTGVEGEKMLLFIKAPNHVCTVNYNLFSPLDAKDFPATYHKTRDLLSERPCGSKEYPENTPRFPLNSLPKDLLPECFEYGAVLKFHESKTIQFKNYYSKIFHDGNPKQLEKFQRQFSAFGNTIGGMFLLGITDQGKVEGQSLNETAGLEEKVERIVNKMSQCWTFTPQRRVHWDLEVFPVVGTDEPTNVVIIVYVAGMPNLGGIFTKCPESFELRSTDHGEKVIHRYEFHEWRQRMLRGINSGSKGIKKSRRRFQTLELLNGPLLTVKGAVEEIRSAFFAMEFHCPIVPEGFERNLPAGAKEVIKQIQQKCSHGRNRAVLVGSLSWHCCLTNGMRKKGVICDLLLFSRNVEGLHLFTVCDSESKEQFTSYAQRTATALKKALVTDGGCHEKFYITYHVVPSGAAQMQDVQVPPSDSRYPIEYNLQSAREKLIEVLTSLVIVLGKRPSVLSNKQGISFFNLLTKEQFQLLYQEIDRHKELWIQGGAGTGKTLVAVEFINELRHRDPSLTKEQILYVCENRGIAQKIRNLEICKCVCRPSFMMGDFPEVKHVILDEVQCFRSEDGNWLEKARELVWQHESDSSDEESNLSDSNSEASLDPDNEPSVVPYVGPDEGLDSNTDESDSNSDDVRNSSPHSSRSYGNGQGYLWLFHDRFQVCHRFSTGIPSNLHENQSFYLTKVIRNSKIIFKWAKRRLGRDATHQLQIGHDFEGDKVVEKSFARGKQIPRIRKELESLFAEGYSKGDVSILYGKYTDIPNIFELTTQLKLPRIVDAEDNDSQDVVVSSFRKYSGLERPVVILVNVEASVSASGFNLKGRSMFCAATRAQVKLIVLNEEQRASKRKIHGKSPMK